MLLSSWRSPSTSLRAGYAMKDLLLRHSKADPSRSLPRAQVEGLRMTNILSATVLAAVLASSAWAQRPALSPATRTYVAIDTPVVALTHARVIDGTGASASADRTIVIRDGRIAAIGDGGTAIPTGALVVDLTG